MDIRIIEPIYRAEAIIELCRHKSVLHLGFIDHSHQYENKIKENKWLHMKIATFAKRIVGIDYLKDDIDKIKKKYGYECYYSDVCELNKLDFQDIFDVIVCGELIEHLENPGLMLDGIKRFMHKNSIIIITSPNPWSKARIKLINNGILEEKWINREHTCWFSFETLSNLLQRKGYDIVFSGYYKGYERINYNNNILYNFLKLIYYRLFPVMKYKYDGLFFIAKAR